MNLKEVCKPWGKEFTALEVYGQRPVVAFLQNQWFKDVERMEKIQASFIERFHPIGREKFVETFLFYSCMTGKRIKHCFGEDLTEKIVWEETSMKMGGTASSVFKADYDHMLAVLAKHEPKIVLAFGKVASEACRSLESEGLWSPGVTLMCGPHPVARGGSSPLKAMEIMAGEVRKLLGITAEVDKTPPSERH